MGKTMIPRQKQQNTVMLGYLYQGIRLEHITDKIARLNHAGCRFLIVSAYYMQTVAWIIGELETVEKIYVFSSETGEDKRYVPLESLAESGREWLEHNSRNLDEVLSSVSADQVANIIYRFNRNISSCSFRRILKGTLIPPAYKIPNSQHTFCSADQVANIIYTSGTTAEPKGIMLTHGNFVSNVLQSDSLIPQRYNVRTRTPFFPTSVSIFFLKFLAMAGTLNKIWEIPALSFGPIF